MRVGIEAINIYGGSTYLDVVTLFNERKLDLGRFNNLLVDQKAVGLPCEDTITNAVNAAKPIIDQLNDEERNSIELLITGTESGLDFGKSVSTYIRDFLKLNRNCRVFEIKQACYAGTAALQMAAYFIASQASPGAKALIISSDMARDTIRQSYVEVSQAVGAAALLLSDNPKILDLDMGANGFYSYEVMDSCRPQPELETGDTDLSLLSYLDCLEKSYLDYINKVSEVDFLHTFDYFAFHTPFAGLVKGAHRKLMRQYTKLTLDQIETDFEKRIGPSLRYCKQVGNIYAATVFMALAGLVDNAEIDEPKRVGLYSYGSGCSSEFYSGIVSPLSKETVKVMDIGEKLSSRYKLTMAEYDRIIDLNLKWEFGIKDKKVDFDSISKQYNHFFEGKKMLVLENVEDFHRKYIWS